MGAEVLLDWKLVARYSGFRCRRRRIYTKSVEDRELAVGRISDMSLCESVERARGRVYPL